ncbi:metal-dependent transcriptional regulator [Sediminivirga luteola]|uniref:Manganese transport regulator n=1 Tax=Sediminivirga luteola TaxID=1774748 RepID=A0A8J2TVJ8_9MICO|nr:metal-dependent transcriptional regulator [Sediminivirga luteola]MCI2264557.1 metal-dependent transcriptional regulator [Sediminivirga luteola]GGA03398.1 transcriptional regulator [Sediminivirga luteola]
MSVSELSPSAQNYLKVIWSLSEWSDEPVTPTGIAARSGVRLSTVSDAVRKLAEQGLVEHSPYKAVALTPAGERHALAMVRRHRLIETFLVQVLGYTWDEVHDEAEQLEHAVSDLMVDRIDALLGRPTRDPHGDPIPSAAGVVEQPEATALATAAPGERVRVVRVADHDPAMLQYFHERGVVVDAVLLVAESAPFSEVTQVRVDGRDEPIGLGRQAAQSVWVCPVEPAAS